MNPIAEVMKGATDLPIALLALVFGLLLRKKGERGWSALFLLVAAAGTLGALVHIVALNTLTQKLLWTVLFLLLYEIIRRFTKQMTDYIAGVDTRERPAVRRIEVLLYFLTLGVLARRNQDIAIYVLVVFMVLMFARIVVCLRRCRSARRKKACALMGLLFFPVALQALADVIPCAVVAEHLFIVAGEVLTFFLGAECAGAPCLHRSSEAEQPS